MSFKCPRTRLLRSAWIESFVTTADATLASPDAGVREAERAIKELGALGVQIYTNVAGAPIDRPEYEAFWAKMNELGKPVWIHPARGAETPDYLDENQYQRLFKLPDIFNISKTVID